MFRLIHAAILLSLLGWAVSAHAETLNCTEITALPATVVAPGVYCLKKDLSTSISTGAAITINADNVLIDCNDHIINGLADQATTQAYGIHSSERKGITVRHCSIRHFYRGIYLLTTNASTGSTSGGSHLIEDNELEGNSYLGMNVQGPANLVRHNRVLNTGGNTNGAYGGILVVGDDSRILDNVVSGVIGGSGNNARGVSGIGNRTMIANNVIAKVTAPDDAFRPTAIQAWGYYMVLKNNSIDVPAYLKGRPFVTGYLSSDGSTLIAGDSGSVCRGNDIIGFDLSWLSYQNATPLSYCRDGGGNVTN